MHFNFSADLQTAKTSSSTSCAISKCFTKAKSQFLIYADYCSNLLSAQDLLDSLCEHNPTVDVKIKVSDVLFLSYYLSCYYCRLVISRVSGRGTAYYSKVSVCVCASFCLPMCV